MNSLLFVLCLLAADPETNQNTPQQSPGGRPKPQFSVVVSDYVEDDGLPFYASQRTASTHVELKENNHVQLTLTWVPKAFHKEDEQTLQRYLDGRAHRDVYPFKFEVRWIPEWKVEYLPIQQKEIDEGIPLQLFLQVGRHRRAVATLYAFDGERLVFHQIGSVFAELQGSSLSRSVVASQLKK